MYVMQAADLLAIEGHVSGACSALAARLFTKRKRHRSSADCDRAQVHLHRLPTRFECWLVSLLQQQTFSAISIVCSADGSTNLKSACLPTVKLSSTVVTSFRRVTG
jgi:hypothetical protein